MCHSLSPRFVFCRCMDQNSILVPAAVDCIDSTVAPSFTSARTIGLQVKKGIVPGKETDHALRGFYCRIA